MILADLQQRQSALDTTRSFIVQAPAGSGKTGLLVKRYLRLLCNVNTPEEILAITFTRKATAEMRVRILTALKKAQGLDCESETQGYQDPELQRIAAEALHHDQQQNWNLTHNVRRLKILTIDALCLEIVRSMPWVARFGATPTLLTAYDANQCYMEAALTTLKYVNLPKAQKHQSHSLSQHTQQLLNLVDFDFIKAQTLLANILQKRDQWMRGLETLKREEYEQMWRTTIEVEIQAVWNMLPKKLKRQLQAGALYAAENSRTTHPNHAIRHCINLQLENAPTIKHFAIYKSLSALLLTNKGEFRKTLTKNEGFPADKKNPKQDMLKLIEDLRDIPNLEHQLALIPKLPEPVFTEKQWQILQTLLTLLPHLAAELRLIFKERNQSDYVEISQRAEMALGKLDQPSDLALLLDYQISHILMDEVQDTSQAQLDLLTKLVSGWQPDDGRTLFFVGDPMQSIYGFREAEISNFHKLQNKGLAGHSLHSIQLKSNFRSDKKLVDWSNQVFQLVFSSAKRTSEDSVRFSSSYATQSVPITSEISLNPITTRKDEENETATISCQAIVQKITQEQAQNPFASIGVLGRTRAHLTNLSRALNESGISHQAIELSNILHRPATRDLISLTRALLKSNDRIAWLAALRAPWCGMRLKDLGLLCVNNVSDNILALANTREITKNLSKDGSHRLKVFLSRIQVNLENRGQIALSKRVKSAWLSIGGPACVEQHALTDCQKYFKMLEGMEKNHIVIHANSIEQAANKIWSESNHSATVQLLTIHKAKGLEFDVVLLPELHKQSSKDKAQLLRWIRKPNELLVATLPHGTESAGANNDHLKYDYLKHLQAEKTSQELARVLYVACTRAKKKLHLFLI